MRIGLFGGSFNPIHNSHVKVMKDLLNFGAVDEVWVIPCGSHAFNKALVSAERRVKMIELAIREMEGVKICDIELKSGGKSYTINTTRKLKREYPQHEFFLIVGSDIIDEITKWHRYKTLLEEMSFFVFKRSKNDISSTKIRKLLKEGKRISGLVSEYVEGYIIRNRLYG